MVALFTGKTKKGYEFLSNGCWSRVFGGMSQNMLERLCLLAGQKILQLRLVLHDLCLNEQQKRDRWIAKFGKKEMFVVFI